MPELAEVYYYAHRWEPAIGETITKVRHHPRARVFRRLESDPAETLTGSRLARILTHGKQMCFRFAQPDSWLGVHLGMSGKLTLVPLPYAPDKHDHLVLETGGHALVFTDPRMFGEIRLHAGAEPPAWWSGLPPECLSAAFDQPTLDAFLKRRAKAPLKAVLLMQERFPGIGNWMADEILWRAGIHPATPAGSLTPSLRSTLFQTLKEVCSDAMCVIGSDWGTPPDSWLFNHRWQDGGMCPKTGARLQREEIGGRTTCWSPKRQPRR